MAESNSYPMLSANNWCNAHKSDIDNIIPDLRVVVQELLYLAGLK